MPGVSLNEEISLTMRDRVLGVIIEASKYTLKREAVRKLEERAQAEKRWECVSVKRSTY